MDRIRLCPEPMTKEAKDLTTAGRERIKPKNFVFPKEKGYPIHDASHARNALARVSQHGTPAEKAQVRARVHTKFPGIGEEKKGAAVDEDAIDKLAAALALGATLAEDDLLGLRKEATEIAGRLMAKGATATKVSTEQAPPSPGLPQGPGSQPPGPGSLPGAVPPTPAPKPPAPPMGGGMTPIASLQPQEAKFASIMENTRKRMLGALLKTGVV